MVRVESAFIGLYVPCLYYLNETARGTTPAIRPGRIPVLSIPVYPAGNQDVDRRGALALRAAPAGKRAREDRRRGAHQFRRPPLQLSLCQARSPSAHGR